MSFVQTVLGDVSANDLGACYAHEHIIIDSEFIAAKFPAFRLDSVETAARELADFFRAGGRAMIDSMPGGCGRNALKLAEISRRASVHIVAPTGLHLQKYYPPGHWSERATEAEMAEFFISEIKQGLDHKSEAGVMSLGAWSARSGGAAAEAAAEKVPVNNLGAAPAFSDRLPVEACRPAIPKAGVIKIATPEKIEAREQRIFAAAAAAHRHTGCPILTHTEQGKLALEQIDLLRQHGADLRHVCLSHTDRQPDAAYHREILSSGVKVEFDSAFRWQREPGNPTLELILALLDEFPTQVMLGMDAARRSYWRHYGGQPGLDFLLVTFANELKQRGVTDACLQNIFVNNPAETFSFLPTT